MTRHIKSNGPSLSAASYRLDVTRVSGTLDTAKVAQALREGARDAGLSIDSTSSLVLNCTCDLTFESREYVIVNAMTYGALVRCSTGTASFEASAEKEHLTRLLTAAGVAGWILSGNDAWYIPAAGVTGDVLATSTSTANAHAQAARRAMSQGIKSLNGTLKK